MRNIELLNRYLSENFNNLLLKMPLFYNSKIGIRYEIGNIDKSISEKQYKEFSYLRSKMIFDEIFSYESNIFLVINENRNIEYPILNAQAINIYKNHLKNKDKYKEVEISEMSYCYQEEGDELLLKTFRHCLSCKITDMNAKQLIKTIVNHIGVSAFEYNEYNEVYFINKDKNIIYHIYNNEGLDVIAKEKKTLKSIYDNYNNWILDYDKERISKIFEW